MLDHHYSDHKEPSVEEAEKALRLNRPDDLKRAVIGIALNSKDRLFAEQYCSRLAGHEDEQVRGNAVLGLGHIARRFGELSSEIKALIEKGLSDSSPYVRGQSCAAADDVGHFLGWVVRRPSQPAD